MIEVKISGRSVTEIMDIVRELRENSLVQGVHFDFAFYQKRWDDMLGAIPTQTVFTFYVEKYATLFALKYI